MNFLETGQLSVCFPQLAPSGSAPLPTSLPISVCLLTQPGGRGFWPVSLLQHLLTHLYTLLYCSIQKPTCRDLFLLHHTMTCPSPHLRHLVTVTVYYLYTWMEPPSQSEHG